MQMTEALLRSICKEQGLYLTPSLNDVLYCNFRGITRISCLDGYTALKSIFLDGNALPDLQGLPPLPNLTCL